MPRFTTFSKVYTGPGYPIDPNREQTRNFEAGVGFYAQMMRQYTPIVEDAFFELRGRRLLDITVPAEDFNMIGWDLIRRDPIVKIVNEGYHSW